MGSLGLKLVSLGVAVAASAAKMLAMVMVLVRFKFAGVVRLTVKSLKWFNRFSLPKAASAKATLLSDKLEPAAVPVMDAARDDVLAFLHFPQEHWRKVWSTNPLERLNKEIKRRTNVVGIFPNDAAIVRLVGSQLLEQQEEWQLERRRFFSEATMAKIPEPEEALEFTDADPFAQPDEPIS